MSKDEEAYTKRYSKKTITVATYMQVLGTHKYATTKKEGI